jgi:plastocyanin
MNLQITKSRWARAGAIVALATLAAACGGDDDGVRTVTGADYSFQNLPREVDAGTEFKFTNSSTRELHEMVVIRIPDSETRPVAELVRLPEDQLQGIIGNAEPAMVLLAPPGGGEMIKAVGDGKINEPGRYAVVCFIPTGADPQAYLNAPQTGGPPQVDGGPPHAAQGMFGEITVK